MVSSMFEEQYQQKWVIGPKGFYMHKIARDIVCHSKINQIVSTSLLQVGFGNCVFEVAF